MMKRPTRAEEETTGLEALLALLGSLSGTAGTQQ